MIEHITGVCGEPHINIFSFMLLILGFALIIKKGYEV
jgi:hypothetical protein